MKGIIQFLAGTLIVIFLSWFLLQEKAEEKARMLDVFSGCFYFYWCCGRNYCKQ